MSCTKCENKAYKYNPEPYIWCSECGRDLREPKQRSIPQSRMLHAYFDEVATELNNTGQDVKAVLSKSELDIPWDGEMVKRLLYHKIIRMKYEKTSTADLTTKELSEAADILAFHLSTHCKLDMPFVSDSM